MSFGISKSWSLFSRTKQKSLDRKGRALVGATDETGLDDNNLRDPAGIQQQLGRKTIRAPVYI